MIITEHLQRSKKCLALRRTVCFDAHTLSSP
jgi:hypothetical protein